ncbi:glycosyltransferase family 2 protein [Lacibacter sp. H375]|uniref:glycosyltransferase family 2 protein n=1 Tax=Lacibacter sp. H375 TaxID=3133424 RepID=UPI0030BC1B11
MTQTKHLDLLLVTPVYNEAANLPGFITDWVMLLKTLDIDFVIRFYNDGSTDESKSRIKEYADQYSEIEIVEKQNSGHGSTLIKAYSEAKNAEWIFQVDSDHELDHHRFKLFWNSRQQYDLLLGQRFAENKQGVFRILLSKVSFLMIRSLFGKGINDCNCPYRLMRLTSVHSFLPKIPTNCFAPNVLLSALFIQAGQRVTNISVNQVFRKKRSITGFSYVMLKGGFNTFICLIKLRFFSGK